MLQLRLYSDRYSDRGIGSTISDDLGRIYINVMPHNKGLLLITTYKSVLLCGS